ncbi:MAG: hypothetical protein QOH84_5831 [Kribbellaceae bacterium]|nr:hypothetical protein [Kribbellaceae bacterium]
MRYQLHVTGDGLVVVALDADLPLMSEALKDSLRTSPPPGAPQDGPSTYWLDRAIRYLLERMETAALSQSRKGTSRTSNYETAR